MSMDTDNKVETLTHEMERIIQSLDKSEMNQVNKRRKLTAQINALSQAIEILKKSGK